MLNVTRSEDLLAELTVLLQTGKNHLDTLSLPRHRSSAAGGARQQQTLSTTTCCSFLRPIFEQYFLQTDEAQTQLETFLMEAESLLATGVHEEEEEEARGEDDESEEKVSYNEVARLVQDAKGVFESSH